MCTPEKVKNIWICILANSGADPERDGKLHGQFRNFVFRVEWPKQWPWRLADNHMDRLARQRWTHHTCSHHRAWPYTSAHLSCTFLSGIPGSWRSAPGSWVFFRNWFLIGSWRKSKRQHSPCSRSGLFLKRRPLVQFYTLTLNANFSPITYIFT